MGNHPNSLLSFLRKQERLVSEGLMPRKQSFHLMKVELTEMMIASHRVGREQLGGLCAVLKDLRKVKGQHEVLEASSLGHKRDPSVLDSSRGQ